MTATAMTLETEESNHTMEEFNYVDLHTIDPTFKPVDAGVYTLQVNSIKGQTVEIKTGKNAGKTKLLLKGSFTIVGDPNFSGRKLWYTFWADNRINLVELRKLMDATGIEQQQGESLTDYGTRFGELNPPAEFKCFVAVEKDYKDPNADVNVIKFRQATAV